MNIAKLTVIPAIAGLALVSQGCLATHKHVREQIAPVSAHVDSVEKQSNENKQSIGELDRQVASTDEKATEAGRRAQQAADAAQRANDAASQAGQRADSARSAADQVGSRLDQTVANLDNYHLVDTQKVYFAFGKSMLTKAEKAKLDEAVQKFASSKNFVIEVEGYTDRTGHKDYNLALSQKRADAVLRYLTLHNVPLRKIHVVGVGSEDPNADNATRAARKENRRVDIRVYALDLSGNAALQSSNAPAAQTGQSGMSDRSVQSDMPRSTATGATSTMPATTPAETPQQQ